MQINRWIELFHPFLHKLSIMEALKADISEADLNEIRESAVADTDNQITRETVSSFNTLRKYYQECLNNNCFEVTYRKNAQAWFNVIEFLTYAILLNKSLNNAPFLKVIFDRHWVQVNNILRYFKQLDMRDRFGELLQHHRKFLFSK